MKIKIKKNPKIITKDSQGDTSGFLIPIYNIKDNFFDKGKEPEQVYLTVISPGKIKGPHLHYIRTGCFTCIKGNARFILKTKEGYDEIYSGESYNYKTVIVPTGVAAALQNLGTEDAFILNMPNPAWTPDMNDEHHSKFDDFDFSI
jgi:dTDP-4-dehydrorhamnose 3,5-epimerase-like enzyme|tara:strand:+ start:185 stop:622 length:438 start_codon:yes stop_codon:yes gene_type:complete